MRALEALTHLGAFDNEGTLTQVRVAPYCTKTLPYPLTLAYCS